MKLKMHMTRMSEEGFTEKKQTTVQIFFSWTAFHSIFSTEMSIFKPKIYPVTQVNLVFFFLK